MVKLDKKRGLSLNCPLDEILRDNHAIALSAEVLDKKNNAPMALIDIRGREMRRLKLKKDTKCPFKSCGYICSVGLNTYWTGNKKSSVFFG